MNLRLISINIENFRSIEDVYIELANQGIVIVKGINEYEDKASSNGSGKSSIFEAIVYAFFEETSAGEKDVSNRITKKGYKLVLNFCIDNDTYKLTRQSHGNKSSVELIKNGEDISARNKTDTNKLILSILGINKDIFLDSVFLSQNINTNLAVLSPTARKERLEILTNTDYTINKFKDALKDKQLTYENNKLSSQLEIEKLKGTQSAILEQRKELEDKIYRVKLELQKLKEMGTIEDINNQIQDIELKIIDLNNLIAQKQSSINEIDMLLNQNKTDSQEYVLKSNDLNIDISSKKDEIGLLENEVNECQLNIVNFNNLITMYNNEIVKIRNSDKCPTCGKKLDDADEVHIENAINEKLKHIQEAQYEIDKNTNKINEKEAIINQKVEEGKALRQQLNEIELKLQEYNDIETKYNKDRMIYTADINDMQKHKDEYSKSIIQLNQKKVELSKVVNSNLDEYNEMIEKLVEQYEDTQLKIDIQRNDYEVNNQYVEVVKNSLQLVVKEFRTYLLKTSIEYLNKLLEIYSKELFSNDIDRIIIVEDDTKLDIRLGDASYESLSGGEKTRVNIALLLAQKSLASTLGNISCNIIILDEVLGYCDVEAENNVIQLINQELEVLESIYMISHKEIPIAYDNQLIVVKNIEGISSVDER